MKNYKKIYKKIFNYKTKHKEGFIDKEIKRILKYYNIDQKAFNEKLGVHTGLLIDNDFITYHHDVYTALICCIENRELDLMEWD